MMSQVVFDEGLDEVIAMVVARLHAQMERLARFLTGGLESLGLQLLGQEAVRFALVDKDATVEASTVTD
jgi:hypothetical protein